MPQRNKNRSIARGNECRMNKIGESIMSFDLNRLALKVSQARGQ